MSVGRGAGHPFRPVAFVLDGIVVSPSPSGIGSNGTGSAVMVVQYPEDEVRGTGIPNLPSLQPMSSCSGKCGCNENGDPWPRGGPIGAHLATRSELGLPQDLGARRRKAVNLRSMYVIMEMMSNPVLRWNSTASSAHVTLPPWSWHLAPPVACTAVHCSAWSQSVGGCQISAGTLLAARWSFPWSLTSVL